MEVNYQTIYLGAGCFWCVEAVFQRLAGVEEVVSGYMGGHVDNPTYKQICTGTTGHAEVAKVTFDSTVITLAELLEIFWTTHDPTTLNQQGNDRGTQYRSAIFYNNESQKTASELSIQEVAPTLWKDPIVTEITAAPTFYPAERYHQNYYNSNGYAPYCRFVVNPKVTKLKATFHHKLKPIYKDV